jgi:hypothetical protein
MEGKKKSPHARVGAGRPRGTTNARKAMVAKLDHLKLSPLVEHLKLIVEHDKVVQADNVSNVPSATYTANIIKHRGDLLRTLLPYQYNIAIEEKQAVSSRPPIKIKLQLGDDQPKEKERSDG